MKPLISILAMFESYLKNVNAYDRFIEMIKPSTLHERLNTSPVDYVGSSFGWSDVEYWKKIHNDWIEELFTNGRISDKEVSENRLD